jgi:hypothetical protein
MVKPKEDELHLNLSTIFGKVNKERNGIVVHKN